MRYPREARLRKKAEYQALYARGSKFYTPHFIVFTLPRTVLSGQGSISCRTGISVSKKVGNAVVRNRLKRVLREFFRLHVSSRPLALDICVIVRKFAGVIPNLRLTEAELCPLFERIFHTA